MPNTKELIIVGAGYGGLNAALGLKSKKTSEFNITVIDREPYQLLTFNLFEAATAEEEFTTISQVKSAISLPLQPLLQKKGINFFQADIKEINLGAKTLRANSRKFNFDYLILAPGSTSDYMNIEGAEQFAQPLKTFTDAARLRNKIEFAFNAHSVDMTKKHLRFVVAGGGYTGCEMAAELSKFVEILCWKYEYPRHKVEIVILEAANELVSGFSKRLSVDTLNRLKELGINVLLSSMIAKVSQQFVELSNGERFTYDALIWSVGVKARQLPIQEKLEIDRKGRLSVNHYLQIKGYHDVFALGDAANIMDVRGKVAHASAQDAIDQAKYLVKNMPKIINNKKPKTYKVLKHGFIVSLGGKWAILDYNGFYIKGLLAYVIRQLAYVEYVSSLLGWYKAVTFMWFQNKIFGRND